MAFGERLRQARLEAGMTQRELAKGLVTRSMLSLMENGAAMPSLDTLLELSRRLGKSVGWLLEGADASPSHAQAVASARKALERKDYKGILTALEPYTEADEMFDEEVSLLRYLAVLGQARQALGNGKNRQAARLLRETDPPGLYLPETLERERALLLSQAAPEESPALAEKLPPDDRELLLRARAALLAEDGQRAGAILDAASERTAQWNLLRGDAYLFSKVYDRAAACFALAEKDYPRQTAPRLEICYRELGDYRLAYQYACRQRGEQEGAAQP